MNIFHDIEKTREVSSDMSFSLPKPYKSNGREDMYVCEKLQSMNHIEYIYEEKCVFILIYTL